MQVIELGYTALAVETGHVRVLPGTRDSIGERLPSPRPHPAPGEAFSLYQAGSSSG